MLYYGASIDYLDGNPFVTPDSTPMLRLGRHRVSIGAGSGLQTNNLGTYPNPNNLVCFGLLERQKNGNALVNDGYIVTIAANGAVSVRTHRVGSAAFMTVDVYGIPNSIPVPSSGIVIYDATGKAILTNESYPLRLAGAVGVAGDPNQSGIHVGQHNITGKVMGWCGDAGRQGGIIPTGPGTPPQIVSAGFYMCAFLTNSNQTLLRSVNVEGTIGQTVTGETQNGNNLNYVRY